MKKFLAVLCLSILLLAMLGALSAGAADAQTITVTLNGKALPFKQEPLNVHGRLLVPYRPIAEAIGATVTYDAASKTVHVTKGPNSYLLPLNGRTASLNGVDVALETPPVLVNGVTLVPLRFVSEYLGLDVHYDNAKRTVSLTSSAAPAIKLIAPAAGSMLHGDKVTVSVAVFNFQLADFVKTPAPRQGQGHVHLWLDTDPKDPKAAYKMTEGGPIVFDQVKAGEHTLTVQLVGNDHKPVVPEVKQVVHFSTMGAEAAGKTYSVDLTNFSFSPNLLTIEAGAKVIFTNKDDVQHTVTAVDGSFDSGLFGKGNTFEVTFSKPGEYKIYCKPHKRMVATIVVK
jgi:plastocyanin